MKMATPESNLTTARGPADVNGNHASPHPPRHLQNFNTFQYVSQLVSATPPYLFNMSSPAFPGNFFSDLLRRMAPRAGTPGMPLDANLQQHIRAALLTKGTPPPSLPQAIMPPPALDLAALNAQQRHQSLPPTSLSQEKGIKRSLFSDIGALSACEGGDNGVKRPRLEDPREERIPAIEAPMPSPFLMQPPFLPSAVVPHSPDVMSHWSARASLLRPQMPIPSHVPPAPLDPYRLLLDLRLAGQLRSMAATQAMQHHKEPPPLIGHPPLVPSSLSTPGRLSPPYKETRPIKDELQPSVQVPTSQAASSAVLRGDDSRVSAFHPPGRDGPADTSDDEGNERRCNSRNSSNSSSCSLNKDGLGPQYILKNLTEIYRTIDVHRSGSGPTTTTNVDTKNVSELLHSAAKLVKPSLMSQNEVSKRLLEADKSNNNGGDCHNKPPVFKEERHTLDSYPYYATTNGTDEHRPKTPDSDDLKQEERKSSSNDDLSFIRP